MASGNGDGWPMMADGTEVPMVRIPPAQTLAADVLAAVGMKGRTADERLVMSDLCKDVRGKIPVTDLCEQELPKLLEKAKKKLEKTSKQRVLEAVEEMERTRKECSESQSRHGHQHKTKPSKAGTYALEDIEELLIQMANSTAAPEDLKQLQAEVPSLTRMYRIPHKKRYTLEDVVVFVAHLDEKAARIKSDREQETVLIKPPVMYLPQVPGATLRRRPFSLGYKEACGVQAPEMRLRQFARPRCKELRERAEKTLAQSQSLPTLQRPKSLTKPLNPMLAASSATLQNLKMDMTMTEGSSKRVTFQC